MQQESGPIYPRFLEPENAALWMKNGNPASPLGRSGGV